MSLGSFKYSAVLLKCLGFALRLVESRKLNLGKLWEVFSPEINCIGRKVLVNVIPNVAVITYLSGDPEMLICFAFFSARLQVETVAYFNGGLIHV